MTDRTIPADKPLTERQQKIVDFLHDNPRSTPVDIAYGIGISRGPRRLGNRWSGYMSPAQHVIGSLIGLQRRGLVTLSPRPDGRSGTAYSLRS